MKRRVLIVLLLLVAGTIVNVAVAWGCASKVSWEWMYEGRADSPTANWSVGNIWCYCQQWDAFGLTFVAISHRRSGLPFPLADYRLEVVPTWGDVASLPNEDDLPAADTSTTRLAVGAGWPARSLWCNYQRSRSIDYSDGKRDGGFHLRPFWRRDVGWYLPVWPIWPGFAINTVFYAVVLWLLFAAPFALRRRRRIKRGLCPKCAYDLRGTLEATACPECGATSFRKVTTP